MNRAEPSQAGPSRDEPSPTEPSRAAPPAPHRRGAGSEGREHGAVTGGAGLEQPGQPEEIPARSSPVPAPGGARGLGTVRLPELHLLAPGRASCPPSVPPGCDSNAEQLPPPAPLEPSCWESRGSWAEQRGQPLKWLWWKLRATNLKESGILVQCQYTGMCTHTHVYIYTHICTYVLQKDVKQFWAEEAD